MSNSSPSNAPYADLPRLVANFYSKVAQVVVQSRTSFAKGPQKSTANTWFNYVTDDVECIKEEVRAWKNDLHTPLHIEVFLDMSEVVLVGKSTSIRVGDQIFNSNYFQEQAQLQRGGAGGGFDRQQGDKGGSSPLKYGSDAKGGLEGGGKSLRRNIIVLEQWRVGLERPSAASLATTSGSSIPENVDIYQYLIMMIRSLALLVQILPAYKFMKSPVNNFLKLKLYYRITKVPLESSHFGVSRDMINNFAFAHVLTPMGTISVSTTFRKHLDIELIEADHLVSQQLLEEANPVVVDEHYFSMGKSFKDQAGTDCLMKQFSPGKVAAGESAGLPIPSPNSNLGSRRSQGTPLLREMNAQQPKGSAESNASSQERYGSLNTPTKERPSTPSREQDEHFVSKGIPVPCSRKASSQEGGSYPSLSNKTPPFSIMKERAYKTNFPEIPPPITATPPLNEFGNMRLNSPRVGTSRRGSATSYKDSPSPFKQINSGDNEGRRVSMVSNAESDLPRALGQMENPSLEFLGELTSNSYHSERCPSRPHSRGENSNVDEDGLFEEDFDYEKLAEASAGKPISSFLDAFVSPAALSVCNAEPQPLEESLRAVEDDFQRYKREQKEYESFSNDLNALLSESAMKDKSTK
eukprot:Nk52_evm121s485 gene=Nk52_evmTU121s485